MVMEAYQTLKTEVVNGQEPDELVMKIAKRLQQDFKAEGLSDEDIMRKMLQFGSLLGDEGINESHVMYAACDLLGEAQNRSREKRKLNRREKQ